MWVDENDGGWVCGLCAYGFFLFVVAYFFSACFLQVARCFFDFFWQSFSAFASFCASVETFALGLLTDGSPDGLVATIAGKAPGSSEVTSAPGMDEDKGSVLRCSGGEVGWLSVVNVWSGPSTIGPPVAGDHPIMVSCCWAEGLPRCSPSRGSRDRSPDPAGMYSGCGSTRPAGAVHPR